MCPSPEVSHVSNSTSYTMGHISYPRHSREHTGNSLRTWEIYFIQFWGLRCGRPRCSWIWQVAKAGFWFVDAPLCWVHPCRRWFSTLGSFLEVLPIWPNHLPNVNAWVLGGPRHPEHSSSQLAFLKRWTNKYSPRPMGLAYIQFKTKMCMDKENQWASRMPMSILKSNVGAPHHRLWLKRNMENPGVCIPNKLPDKAKSEN